MVRLASIQSPILCVSVQNKCGSLMVEITLDELVTEDDELPQGGAC